MYIYYIYTYTCRSLYTCWSLSEERGMRAPIVHPTADAFGPPLLRIGVKVHLLGGRFTKLGGSAVPPSSSPRMSLLREIPVASHSAYAAAPRTTVTANHVEHGVFLRPLLAHAAAGAGILESSVGYINKYK